MLTLVIPGEELFNEETNEFIQTESVTLHLEHSLLSLSKWEEKFHKPYLGDEKKTNDEYLSYIACMSLDELDDYSVLERLTDDNVKAINKYLTTKHTATTINYLKEKKSNKKSSRTITSELLYYQMVARAIPFECERWNLDRLLMLIQVYDVEQASTDKSGRMSRSESRDWQHAENMRRRKKHGKG